MSFWHPIVEYEMSPTVLIQDSTFEHRLFHKYTNILGVGDTCILKMVADIARILTSY